jgi:hypothetical protein
MPLPRSRATREQDDRPRATSDEVEQAIRHICKYYRQGQKSLRDRPPWRRDRKESIEEQARQFHMSLDGLRKARQFAAPEVGYTQKQLDDLYDLLRKHRPRFGITHIATLVSVPWPERAELQNRCIKQNWSHLDLRSELIKRFGCRRQSGRRRHVADQEQALLQLDKLTSTWQRLYKILVEERNDGQQQPWILLDTLPKGVRKRIKDADQSMICLREAVIKELDQSRAASYRRAAR